MRTVGCTGCTDKLFESAPGEKILAPDIIRSMAAIPTDPHCLFCRIISGEESAHFVHADDVAVAFLDIRPLFHGHTLIVPRAHHETLAELPPELIAPVFALAQRVSAALPVAMGSQGSFVAINNTVSQSVPHLHVHAIPRTKGDGLRGFFWPRLKYPDDAAAAATAAKIGAALG